MSGGRKTLALVAAAVVLWFFVLPLLGRIFWNRGVLQWDAKSNHYLMFYGKVVDQDGRPLPGAAVTLTLNAFNSQWAPVDSAGRGRMRHDTQKVITDTDGRFTLPVESFDVQTTDVRRNGYHWIESDLKGERGEETNNELHYNERIELGVLGGRQTYKSDPTKPTVYVMLRDGAPLVVHAKMSRGGAESNSTGSKWINNELFWPAKTKPADVTYEAPTTESSHRAKSDLK